MLPKHLGEILETLKRDPHGQIFLNKVNKRDAPNYYEIIKRPMDLGTVGRKLHLYRSVGEFARDLDLIWSNCLVYNTAEYFVDCANEMKMLADSLVRAKERVYPAAIGGICYEGIGTVRVRDKLRRAVAGYLNLAGFRRAEKNVIGILSDITEHRICKELRERQPED